MREMSSSGVPLRTHHTPAVPSCCPSAEGLPRTPFSPCKEVMPAVQPQAPQQKQVQMRNPHFSIPCCFCQYKEALCAKALVLLPNTSSKHCTQLTNSECHSPLQNSKARGDGDCLVCSQT